MSLEQEPQQVRKEGDQNHAAAVPVYERAQSNPNWQAEALAAWGPAANAFIVPRAEYLAGERRIGITALGDGFTHTGDTAHSTATALEHQDTDGGTAVRRTGPDA